MNAERSLVERLTDADRSERPGLERCSGAQYCEVTNRAEPNRRKPCACRLHREAAARIEALEREVEEFKRDKLARSKIDPVTRLHNLADHLAEQRRESPFTAEALELQDEAYSAKCKELNSALAALEQKDAQIAKLLDQVKADNREIQRISELDAQSAAALEQARQQAQQWAQEAKTQRDTVHAAYQVCTGSTGEPGDWNGAEPIRKLAAQLEQAREALRLAKGWIEESDEGDFAHDVQRDADFWRVTGNGGFNQKYIAMAQAVLAALSQSAAPKEKP